MKYLVLFNLQSKIEFQGSFQLTVLDIIDQKKSAIPVFKIGTFFSELVIKEQTTFVFEGVEMQTNWIVSEYIRADKESISCQYLHHVETGKT